MKLSPLDIKRQQFKKVFRGSDPNEVSAFLERISVEMEESVRAQREIHEKVLTLETSLQEYKKMEAILHQTLIQAQETSAKSVENARKEAQLIMQQAEIKASDMLRKALTELTSLKEQMTVLRIRKEAIVSRLRSLLQSELTLLSSIEKDQELGGNETTSETKQRQEIEEIIKNFDQDSKVTG